MKATRRSDSTRRLHVRIWHLHDAGWSQRRIAKELRCSRGSVQHALRKRFRINPLHGVRS